jgi:FdhD protein
MRHLGAGAGGAMVDGATAVGAPGRLQEPSISHAEILAILECMHRHDAVHRAAGSVHSCALFQGGELWAAVEDVSRHNGIDTITGFMALHGMHGADKTLFTTGRLTGEMVMKAAHNGIPVMISRNGTTAMGYELAAKLGMTLIGRAANRRYMCYIGAERIGRDAAPA